MKLFNSFIALLVITSTVTKAKTEPSVVDSNTQDTITAIPVKMKKVGDVLSVHLRGVSASANARDTISSADASSFIKVEGAPKDKTPPPPVYKAPPPAAFLVDDAEVANTNAIKEGQNCLSMGWYLGDKGESCSTTCSKRNLSCTTRSKNAQTKLNTRARFNQAMNQAMVNHHEAWLPSQPCQNPIYNGSRDYAGSPFAVETFVVTPRHWGPALACYPFSSGSAHESVCNVNLNPNHRPLCFCDDPSFQFYWVWGNRHTVTFEWVDNQLCYKINRPPSEYDFHCPCDYDLISYRFLSSICCPHTD